MKTTDWQKNKHRQLIGLILGFLVMSVLWACGGSGGGSDETISSSRQPQETAAWQQNTVRQIDPGGLLSPNIQAQDLGDGRVYLAWFDDENAPPGHYNLQSLTWSMDGPLSAEDAAFTTIVTTDNCKSLSMALDGDENPSVAYQGGEVKACGGDEQADAMFSLREHDAWVEYTGAIGFVERNPVFRDGLAGGDMAMAIDANGDIHLCYMFYYEGCDSMNYNYPDLHYVKKLGNAPGGDVEEETIEGNIYFDGGGIQNNVGKGCAIILDRNGDPVVFYYAELSDGTYGLRTSRRRNNAWESTWVETGIQVEDISCAKDREGNIGVAYYVLDYLNPVTSELSPACLRYAVELLGNDETWRITMVDATTLCGRYPSLAYNGDGKPAIAYYTSESYSGHSLQNLKLAWKKGLVWETEVVAATGDIGLYNTLWFQSDDSPVVCSYSRTDQTIYIFNK